MEVTAWDAAAALTKAGCYAAALCASGATFFLIANASLLRDTQRSSIKRHLLLLLILAAVASVARVVLLSASMGGGFQGMFDIDSLGMLLSAGEGWALALRLGGLVLCTTVFVARLPNSCAFVGAVIVAASFAALGHVHTLKPAGVPTVLLALHLTCAAFWLGALWPLMRVAGDADTRLTAAIADRFGRAALCIVGMLIFAGTFLACRMLPSLSALWTSDYGRLFSTKLLLVAALLTAAAVNKLLLTPRLVAGDATAATSLKRSISIEMVIGGLILLATAAFTSFTGPSA